MTSRLKVLLAFGTLLALSACNIEIQHDLNEREANEIIVLFEREGIPTKKIKEEGGRSVTWMVSVPKAHAVAAAVLLKENELPRPRSTGFEIFNRGSLIPTATEERAMFLQALSGELSRTISSIDGVLDARTHINIPQSDELADRQAPPEPSASVLIKYRVLQTEDGSKIPPSITEQQIQSLVARSVQDMRPENVAVVMTPAAMPGGGLNTAPSMVEIFGIRMASDSVRKFQAVLGLLVIVILGLAIYVVFAKFKEMRRPAPKAALRPPRPRVEM